MITITRRFNFSAAHKLFLPHLSTTENTALFGACASPNWHGHNYVLEITVSGPIDNRTGMIINLNTLKDFIQKSIINELDHKNLNLDVAWLKDCNPTLENLAVSIYNRINVKLKEFNLILVSVKLQETDNNWCTYYGEKNDT